ncbi:MAG: adenine phosphoribosyltransferase, partial [Oscillospiraceae bacterium]|nr:adenine phosphoribosyltransferase [Oscillospiraceae bacterium]
MKTYTLNVAGLTRELPICPINDKLDIAAFIMFSDVELTVECAKELLKKVPEFDIIVTAESKGIPLGYEMSRQSGKNYIVARKSVKLYMTNPVAVEVKSITTDKKQILYLSEQDMNELKDKRVLIADDVISTGESLNSLIALVEKAGGNIVCKSAVLA